MRGFTPQPEEFLVFQSADFDPEAAAWQQAMTERPLYADDYAALLEQCRQAVDRRQRAYPAQIVKGLISAEDAAQDIEPWQPLAGEWQWIVDGTGELPPRHPLAHRIAACDLALARVDQELARGNRTHEIYRQSHLIEAIQWHLHRVRFGAPAVHFWAEMTRKLRAAALCPRCERRADDPVTQACTRTDCGLPARTTAPTTEGRKAA